MGRRLPLLLFSLLPLGIILAGLGVSWGRQRSLVPALPPVLRLTYLFYPCVSSLGFQTLGECECFEQLDGSKLCYLPADYSVECPGDHAPQRYVVSGSLAVALYGVGVPLLYACLLYSCRHAIGTQTNTPLSSALVSYCLD